MAKMKIIDEPVLKKSNQARGSAANKNASLSTRIRKLLGGELYGVLCTQGHGQPYGSLVAYSSSADLRYLYFATPIYTRKYRLLKENRRASFVVDSRVQYPHDMAQVEAITATGKTVLLSRGPTRQKIGRLLGQRHPQLKEFLRSLSCVMIQFKVTRYFYVTRFQEVSQWVPKKTGSLT